MPFASNQGVNIYYESHGQGAPLVLLHGFAAKHMQWHLAGYVEALRDRYRLILIDARGHGNSDKPHERQAYDLDRRLADIVAVLDALDIPRTHCCGYSMGGWLSFGMAIHHPQRVASLIIGGAHPYAEPLTAFDGIDGTDAEAFLGALQRFIGEPVSPQARVNILQNDLVALAAAATDRAGFGTALARIDMPLMLFAGAADQRLTLIQQAAQALHCAEPFMVPGAGHASALFHAQLLAPRITDFLASVRTLD